MVPAEGGCSVLSGGGSVAQALFPVLGAEILAVGAKVGQLGAECCHLAREVLDPLRKCNVTLNLILRDSREYMYHRNRRQAEVILNHEIQMYVQLDKENPGIGNIRGLNLVADKPATIQVSNCRFLGLNKLRHKLLHYPALKDVPVYSRT
jgi:hypothetical protein